MSVSGRFSVGGRLGFGKLGGLCRVSVVGCGGCVVCSGGLI